MQIHTVATLAWSDQMDAQDLARALTAFRGQPKKRTSPMRYTRFTKDSTATEYVYDDESGMAFIVD